MLKQIRNSKTPVTLSSRHLILLFLIAWVANGFAAEVAIDPVKLEFFEKKIRPVLVESCYSCHSAEAKKTKGGLALDTRDATLKGGETGPAVVAGDPTKSLLIKAVRYGDENLKMPPPKDGDKKLTPEKIADLEAWIKMGAPDPRTGGNASNVFAAIMASASNHWAFKPIQAPAIPSVKNLRWVETPVDAFVLANLESRKMAPSPEADKRTLIRRVTYDLTGLPPTHAEIEAFIADRSPNAYPKLVDRLLASPRYGERWGRHWLDVARYADTKGYVGGEEPRYAWSYTYRDYVIRAFNEDLPYDQFIIQQLAADLLPLGDDNRSLAALGFLTLGRRFVNNEQDIIDDRIDVICRGTMALTMQCSRCHDHKYDPLPTRDYYSLYGIMRSSMEPTEKPLLAKQPAHPEFANYQAELKAKQAELDLYVSTNTAVVQAKLREQAGDYLLLVYETSKLTNDVAKENLQRERKLNKVVRDRWTSSLLNWAKTNHPVFAPLFAFHAVTNDFTAKSKELSAKFAANNDPTNKLNPLVANLFVGEPPAAMTNVIQRYGQLLRSVDEHWQGWLKLADPVTVLRTGETNQPAPVALPDANEEQVRQILYASDAPANPPPAQFGDFFLFNDEIKNKIEQLKKNVIAVDVNHPGAPPRAMTMQDKPKGENARVFIRGNPGTPGPEAPRQFLEVLSRGPRQTFTNGSGRLDFARAIVSRDNPLTARVFVNRVWLEHFGVGFVRTPSDFGARSEPPSHPELLDYLAARFMDDGWSIKKLHRLIVMSNTYRQRSFDESRYAARDPENRLLWRQNRRRLDFEAMRDSFLAITGTLDDAVGGKPVDIVNEPLNRRRSVYGLIDRQDLPNLFRIFDFANPDTSSPQRFQTTVAQQALFLMNSAMVIERAKNLVSRTEFQKLDKEAQRISYLHDAVLQREPTAFETRLARQFIAEQPVADAIIPEAVVWQYGYGRYDTNENRVARFSVFPHFTGQNWQGGPKLPDPKLGWLTLSADGGHTGEGGVRNVVIRRWTAPRSGRFVINGELAHPSADGDGVRARVVSSRAGELGQWTVHHTNLTTHVEMAEVQQGDTIDFVVDCRENNGSDTFRWVPVISLMDPAGVAEPAQWDPLKNFMDVSKLPKPMAAWEKLAQILLLSNEFSFLD